MIGIQKVSSSVLFGTVVALLIGIPSSAFAWEKHQSLSRWIVAPSEDTSLNLIWEKEIPLTCGDLTSPLIQSLALHEKTHLPKLFPDKKCGTTVPLREVLQAGILDEPDHGMDEDLPDSADPDSYRTWMGGKTGPTSKGFRHMYFGGWKLHSPLATFQIPFGAIGASPRRVELLVTEARRLIRARELFWGVRVLGWALHYVQDLAQPFHSAQLPSLAMVPWSAPWDALHAEGVKAAFPALVRETTRTIANYHWAFEEATYQELQTPGKSAFSDCLSVPEKTFQSEFKEGYADTTLNSPEALARAVAAYSVKLAPEVGRAVYGYFGSALKEPGIDLARNRGTPDYQKLATDLRLKTAREKLIQVSCKALAQAVVASRALVRFTLSERP